MQPWCQKRSAGNAGHPPQARSHECLPGGLSWHSNPQVIISGFEVDLPMQAATTKQQGAGACCAQCSGVQLCNSLPWSLNCFVVAA